METTLQMSAIELIFKNKEVPQISIKVKTDQTEVTEFCASDRKQHFY